MNHLALRSGVPGSVRRVLTRVIVVGLVALATWPVPPQPVRAEPGRAVPAEYIGIWEGFGLDPQSGGLVHLWLGLIGGASDSVVGTFTYPDAGCGGTLTLTSITGTPPNRSVRFTESKTYGSCPTGRTVVATYTDSGVDTGLLAVTVEAYNSAGVLNTTMERLNTGENRVPSIFQGVWTGSGSQPGSSWTILFGLDTASLGSVVGTSAYPSLRCGGLLTLASAEENRVVFDEDITFGSCVDRGKVVLTVKLPTTLSYQWYYASGSLGSTGTLVRQTTWTSNRPTEEPYVPLLPSGTWDVPFLWQQDPWWTNKNLLKCNELMGSDGCAVTSVAMVMRAYGVDTYPNQLADCLGNDACGMVWGSARMSPCSGAIIERFDWPTLTNLYQDLEERLKIAPVILSLSWTCQSRSCSHFVVVVSGKGSNPQDYVVNDPNFKAGQNMRLSDTLASLPKSKPDGIRVVVLTQQTPLAPAAVEANDIPERVQLTAAETVTGTVSLYRGESTGIVLQLSAASAAASVTDVQITSEVVPEADWQPMTTWVLVPPAGSIQVRFRDALGNVSGPILTGLPAAASDVIDTPQPNIYLPGVWRFR